ncbi:helix-turn-helix domain-containing protein [Exercitatus varius]|uniref:helix-turn-helix domain-containing protein n=1 Tax=Exercitatus varius TaxID=67857 RepID=UPI00294B2E63|nr:helix-turn-helix domain-containing protein [Exercitatus varius]MDG2942768.1 helix-turn-helix domain-containing protein [Exercitatus varius]
MKLSTLLLTLIQTHDSSKRVNKITNYLSDCHENLRAAYFAHDGVNKDLVDISSRVRFKQSDYANPVVLGFLENRQIVSDKIISYADSSSFKQYFRTWNVFGYCLIMPAKNMGAWVFNSENHKLLTNRLFIEELRLIIDSFAETELLYKKNKQLEKQNLYLIQELNKGDIHHYEELQKAYIETNWIDESSQGKRFKRRLINLAQNNRTLAIIGERGYGKKHLAHIIHQLRNANLVKLKEVNLIELNNILEVKNLIEFIFNNTKDYAKETIIFYNVEYLSTYLLKKLTTLLSHEKIKDKQIKIIFLVSQQFWLDKQKTDNWFEHWIEEKYLLENRLLHTENMAIFLEQFSTAHAHKFGRANSLLSDKVKSYIINKTNVENISQLKFLLDIIYNRNNMNLLTDTAELEKLLSQQDWSSPINLAWKMDIYEKNLIYESLIQSDWNKKETAKQLMIPRRTLSHKCQKYGLGKKNAQ